MCSQHKAQNGGTLVSLWICSPTGMGSSLSQISAYLELVMEDWGILPIVTDQMKVPLSTALLQFWNVHFWDQFNSPASVLCFIEWS